MRWFRKLFGMESGSTADMAPEHGTISPFASEVSNPPSKDNEAAMRGRDEQFLLIPRIDKVVHDTLLPFAQSTLNCDALKIVVISVDHWPSQNHLKCRMWRIERLDTKSGEKREAMQIDSSWEKQIGHYLHVKLFYAIGSERRKALSQTLYEELNILKEPKVLQTVEDLEMTKNV